MKTFTQIIEEIDQSDEVEIQKFGQRLFDTCKMYNIKFRVATHSKKNFNNARNEVPITKASVIRILKKGIPKVCKDLEEYMNKKICLQDAKTNLNLPMTITDASDGVIHINTNSAQNKEDYWLPKDQIPIKIT